MPRARPSLPARARRAASVGLPTARQALPPAPASRSPPRAFFLAFSSSSSPLPRTSSATLHRDNTSEQGEAGQTSAGGLLVVAAAAKGTGSAGRGRHKSRPRRRVQGLASDGELEHRKRRRLPPRGRQPDASGRHRAGGQGPRLVGAHVGDAPELLQRGEAADDDGARGHPARADRDGEGQDQRQLLRDEGDDGGDGVDGGVAQA